MNPDNPNFKYLLPKPAHELGYTNKQIQEICKKLGVTRHEFFKDDFVQTAHCDPELGLITYSRNVENAVRNIKRMRGDL